MKTKIIFYSMTGRNKQLAETLARELSAELIEITESKTRTPIKIGVDLLFKRIPKVIFDKKAVNKGDKIILIGPTWFGRISFPLKSAILHIKDKIEDYVFISFSGGGEGDKSNPDLEKEVTDLVGIKPSLFLNIHVADLIDSSEAVTQEQIWEYKVSEEEINEIVRGIVSKVQ